MDSTPSVTTALDDYSETSITGLRRSGGATSESVPSLRKRNTPSVVGTGSRSKYTCV